jgi:Tfp pilus assembly protein PilN
VTQQVNLYQPLFRREKKKFSAAAMGQGVGLVAFGIAAMVGYTLWQTHSLRQQLAQTSAQHAAISKRVDDVVRQFAGSRPRTADEEIARLEADIQGKERIYSLLKHGDLGNTDGFSVYLAAFARQRVEGLRLTSIALVGRAEQLSLQGKTTDRDNVMRYLARLSSEKSLQGIEFDALVLEGPGAKDAVGETRFELRPRAPKVAKTP